MKKKVILIIIFLLFTSTAYAWFLPRLGREIPEELCGDYKKLVEIVEGKEPKVFEGEAELFVIIFPERIVFAKSEILKIEGVIKVKKKVEGKKKTAYLISFQDSSLSWILTRSDIPSQLGVVQGDKDDANNAKIFVIERLEKTSSFNNQKEGK